MKKIFSFVALMLIGLSHVNAQTVMVNALAPTSKSKCDVYKSNEQFPLADTMSRGDLHWGPHPAD